jgi:hypothetical protein
MMRSIVAFYEVDRTYGGPEEGGWWYDSGRFVRAIGFYLTDAAAIGAAQRANRLLERLQRHRRGVDSVLYAGVRYRAFSFTGLPPERFPADSPRYD